MIPTLLIRHPKERKAKCTLEPLRRQPGFVFRDANADFTYDATGDLLLTLDGTDLSAEDRSLFASPAPGDDDLDLSRPRLILLDSTWRLLPTLENCLTGEPIRRRLPEGKAQTAYPRVSKLEPDPNGGLASIEALYLALKVLGDDRPELLDAYHWKDAFLAQFKT